MDADTGLNLELAVGRMAGKGDWRFSYNYSRVEADAVFAAFSQDNIAFGSNYKLHGASFSHAIRKNVLFNLNFYHYRALDAVYGVDPRGLDWVNRLRMNILFNF